jgi:hypothetical protein
MPKILIISACLVPTGDDRGAIDAAEGDIVDVPKDAAAKLADVGRSLYVSGSDDHTKAKLYTAPEALVRAAEAKRKAAAKAEA